MHACISNMMKKPGDLFFLLLFEATMKKDCLTSIFFSKITRPTLVNSSQDAKKPVFFYFIYAKTHSELANTKNVRNQLTKYPHYKTVHRHVFSVEKGLSAKGHNSKEAFTKCVLFLCLPFSRWASKKNLAKRLPTRQISIEILSQGLRILLKSLG